MDFSDLRKLKSAHTIPNNFDDDDMLSGLSKTRSNGESLVKNVLVIYASGSMGANK